MCLLNMPSVLFPYHHNGHSSALQTGYKLLVLFQIRDSAVKKIVRHCPLVTTLVLANCPLISDVTLAEIATNLPRIR